MYPLIAVVILMMFFPNVVRLSVRVYTPFVVFLGVFALLPVSAILFPRFFGFLVAMFCTVVVGLADAVSQASLFGWAGMLPSEYVQALNLGTGAKFCRLSVSSTTLIYPCMLTWPHVRTRGARNVSSSTI